MELRIFGVILAGGQGAAHGRRGQGACCRWPDGRCSPMCWTGCDPQVEPWSLSANGDPARFAGLGLPGACRMRRRKARCRASLPPCSGPRRRGRRMSSRPRSIRPFCRGDLVPGCCWRPKPCARRAGTCPDGRWRPPDQRALAGVALAPGTGRFSGAKAGPRSPDFTDAHGAARADFPDATRLSEPEHARRSCRRRSPAERCAMKVYGVIGWKNSGKTSLMERLVAEITARGFQRLDRQACPSRRRSGPARQGQLPPPAGGRARGGAGLGRPVCADGRTSRARNRSCRRSLRALPRSIWCWSKATSATPTPRSRSGAPRPGSR